MFYTWNYFFFSKSYEHWYSIEYYKNLLDKGTIAIKR